MILSIHQAIHVACPCSGWDQEAWSGHSADTGKVKWKWPTMPWCSMERGLKYI